VEKDKSPAATPSDQTGGLDAAQRLAAFLGDEPSLVDQMPSAPDRVRSAPHGVPVPGPAWASICPYLLDASGTWRAAQPSRDHRCTAVTPAERLGTETQRRLCLGAGHLDCPLFLAARELRARNIGDVAAVPPGRPFARTAPVILQRPSAVAIALSTARTSLPQLGLVILMLLAAAALVLARFITP
jgi:hypothetical protein